MNELDAANELTALTEELGLYGETFDLGRPCPACHGRCYDSSKGVNEPCGVCYGEGYAPR